MRPGTRFFVLSGLIIGCALAPSFAFAQGPCSGMGCLGATYPALVDTNENGMPDPGTDTPITINPFQAMVTIDSPWDCNPFDGDNMFFLSNPDQGDQDSDGTAVANQNRMPCMAAYQT